MNKPDKTQSSEKENKKVQTDKQFNDNEVREGKADSINSKDADDEQHKKQEEYLNHNNNSKDKG